MASNTKVSFLFLLHPAGGIRKASNSFTPANQPTHFYIWVPWRENWFAFDLNTGQLTIPSQTAIAEIDVRATTQANHEIFERPKDFHRSHQLRSLKFLTLRPFRNDTAFLEKCMRSPTFHATHHSIGRFDNFTLSGGSDVRDHAERLLHLLKRDGELPRIWLNKEIFQMNPAYKSSRFAALHGSIQFARKLRFQESIHIQLTPLPETNAAAPPSPILFTHPVDDVVSSYRRAKQYFTLTSLTPGAYRVQVLHDAAPPFIQPNQTSLTPSPGDYTLRSNFLITLFPDKTVELNLVCKTKAK